MMILTHVSRSPKEPCCFGFSLLFLFFVFLNFSSSCISLISLSVDLLWTDLMDEDVIIEETAKEAAAEAEKIAAEEAAKEDAGKAEQTTAAEAARGLAGEEAGKGLAGDQPSSSEAPSSSHYIRAGKNAVSMPGTARLEELVEGQSLDGEIITTAAVSDPKEEHLLQAIQENYQKLLAHHQARKEKLDSRAAIIETAEGDFQQRLDETRSWY